MPAMGAFDEASSRVFQSVLATKIPASRKFDFSLDYEVNSTSLGVCPLCEGDARSGRRVRNGSSISRRRGIAAYRRILLAIDSENAGQPTTPWAWPTRAPPWSEKRASSANAATPDGKVPEPIAADSLLKLAASAVDIKVPQADRRIKAQRLAREIARFVDGPRPKYQSRLAPLFELVEILGPAWDTESDPETFRSLTRALEVTHERLHERLRPDETAEGRVFALARRKSAAANANAQSIVIHSLHRPGAPGLDVSVRPALSNPSTQTTTTARLAGRSAASAPENQE